MDKPMTASQLKDKLPEFDTYSRKNDGSYLVRRSFFYTHGVTTQNQINKVKAVFPNAIIIDSGEVWKPFKGGASVAAQSHWYVQFKLTESTNFKKELRPLIESIIKEAVEGTELDKYFKNMAFEELSIMKKIVIKPDRSGPHATTATSIDGYLIHADEESSKESVVKDWAESVFKSSYMVDREIKDIKKMSWVATINMKYIKKMSAQRLSAWLVTVETTVWQN